MPPVSNLTGNELPIAGVQTPLIPDLCQISNAFRLILLAEILTVLYTIVTLTPGQSLWVELGVNSILVLWNTLLVAGLFCALRPWLNRTNITMTTLWCCLIVTLVILFNSLLTLRFVYQVLIDFFNPQQQWFLFRSWLAAIFIVLMWLRYLYLRRQVLVGIAAESNARFESLQARIQPHFLFNTINTIASLIPVNAEKAETTLEHLATLLRTSLKPSPVDVSLDQELETCRLYLEIERLRLGNKLQIDWQIDPHSLECRLPQLTLQPLVENAVYHGIQRLSRGGQLTIKTQLNNDYLLLVVSNPKPETGYSSGNQIAQSNINQRLLIRYGEQATMKVTAQLDHYCVEIRIPGEMN